MITLRLTGFMLNDAATASATGEAGEASGASEAAGSGEAPGRPAALAGDLFLLARGDADLLGRRRFNLLDNAIKVSAGGGRVSVELAARRDSAAACDEICVVDDGPGIPAQMQARVFVGFFRGDPARGRVEPTETSGAGFGLAISRRIAEAHGGTLRLVSSRPGHTEFCVTLPAPVSLEAREGVGAGQV